MRFLLTFPDVRAEPDQPAETQVSWKQKNVETKNNVCSLFSSVRHQRNVAEFHLSNHLKDVPRPTRPAGFILLCCPTCWTVEAAVKRDTDEHDGGAAAVVTPSLSEVVLAWR